MTLPPFVVDVAFLCSNFHISDSRTGLLDLNLSHLQMEKIDVRHCPDNNIVNLPVLRLYREPDQIINLIYLFGENKAVRM